MKRYSMKAYKDISEIFKSLGGVFYTDYEDSLGEWVKWEDHKATFFRFTEIYEDRIRELKSEIRQLKNHNHHHHREDGTLRVQDAAKCNCMGKPQHEYWKVCPHI